MNENQRECPHYAEILQKRARLYRFCKSSIVLVYVGNGLVQNKNIGNPEDFEKIHVHAKKPIKIEICHWPAADTVRACEPIVINLMAYMGTTHESRYLD